MKTGFKRLVLCLMIILGFVFVSACNKENDENGDTTNVAPIFESFEIVGKDSKKLSFYGNDNTVVLNLSSNNEENPFGSGKKTIEEKINEEIEIGEQITVDYTASINEYVYAITKIKNPSGKAISSITINGQRYASNLFEIESNKEKIILKLSVGNDSQIKTYTLEKIKYIEGNDVKDVTISGDVEKLVKVGNLSSVTHQLSDLSATEDSVNFIFNLMDNSSLIEKTKGTVTAVLYDGYNLIEKELSLGTQNVTFNDLSSNKKYQYAVVATYDKLDGNGKRNYILAKNVIVTDEAVIENYTISKANISNGSISVLSSAKQGDTITITVTPNTGYQLAELYYIENGSSAKHTINNREFTMPNKNITIYALFEQIAQGDEYEITVAELVGGTFEIVSIANAGQLVTFIATPLNGWDLYDVVYVKEGDTLYDCVEVEGNSFIMPESNITIYALFDISYTISTNAINGTITVQNKAFEDDLVEIKINPDFGYKLDYLYYVEDGKSAKHEIEKDYLGYRFFMPANDITLYATFVQITTENSFTITVDDVVGGTFEVANWAEEDDWVEFTATPNQGYKLFSLYYIEEGDTYASAVHFSGDSFMMPASNITIYVVFERAYTINIANTQNGKITVDNLGVENEYISVYVEPNSGYKLKELYYIEEGSSVKHEIKEGFLGMKFYMPRNNITIYGIFKQIQSSETLVIDSKEDLISLSTNEDDWNKTISLTVDIDLGGVEWTPIGNYETPFEGVFNGNGHIISNFKITEQLDYVGLFGYVEHGTIINLKITDYTYNLDYSDNLGDFYIGGLAASVNYGNIEKNHASGNITILGDVNVFVGGLIGEAVDTSIKNSYTNGNITGTLSGYMFIAGGLVGIMDKDDFFSEYSIQYCYSTTNVSITNIDEEPGYYQLSVGGLVGESDYNISNSYATGNVSAISNNFPSNSIYYINVGGLVAETGAYSSISGYQLDTQNIFATDSKYTSINNDATKYTLEQILNNINSSFYGWDDKIWNLSLTENPTLK